MRDLGFGHDSSLVGALGDRIGWQSEARCAGVADPDRFFPERGQPVSAAKRLCNNCPVREPCRDYAIDEDIQYGVWGGMTTRQRRQYAFQQSRQPEPEQMYVFDRSKRLEKMLRLIRLRYVPRQLASV